MNTQVMNSEQALKEGWSILKRYPVAFGGFAAFLGIVVACASVPTGFLKFVLLVTIPFPFLGGLHTLFLKAARDSDPRFSDLSSGFRRFGDWWVVGFAFAAMAAVALMVARLIIVLCTECYEPTGGMFLRLLTPIPALIALLPSVVAALYICNQHIFTPFAVADGFLVKPADRRSLEIVPRKAPGALVVLSCLGLLGPVGLFVIGLSAFHLDIFALGWPALATCFLAAGCLSAIPFAGLSALYSRMAQSTPHEAREGEIEKWSYVSRPVMGPVGAFREGWAILRKHPVTLVGFAAFAAITVGCVMVPTFWGKFAALITIPFPLLGGLHTLFLKAARDSDPRLSDLFSGFRSYVDSWFNGFLFTLLAAFSMSCGLLTMVPFAILTFSDGLTLSAGSIAGYGLSFLLGLYLFTGYLFGLFRIADDPTIRRADRESLETTKGRITRVFLTLVSIALAGPVGLLLIGLIVKGAGANAFGWPGWVVFWLGVVASGAISFAGMTAVYCDLAKPANEPASEQQAA